MIIYYKNNKQNKIKIGKAGKYVINMSNQSNKEETQCDLGFIA